MLDSDYVDENGSNYDIFRSADTPDADFILSSKKEFSDNDNESNDTSINNNNNNNDNYHSKYPFIPLQLIIPFNVLHEFVHIIDSDLLLKIPSINDNDDKRYYKNPLKGLAKELRLVLKNLQVVTLSISITIILIMLIRMLIIMRIYQYLVRLKDINSVSYKLIRYKN